MEEDFDLSESIEDLEDIDEIDELCDIIKNESVLSMFDNNVSVKKKIIIKDSDKITSNKATKYEITRALTFRITQIERGSEYFIDSSNLNNAKDIAKKEIIERKTPIIIERIVDLDKKNNIAYCERWKLNEMAYPENYIFL